jgi:thiamine-monophosphate kinase
MNENELIDQLKKQVPVFGRALVGIGDDAAVLRCTGDYVVTTDMLMDGVDFDCTRHSPEQIARKSIAVNLSDIAAMGARPTTAVISVALPKTTTAKWLQSFNVGLLQICREFSVEIVGGDTNSWEGPLVISACVNGSMSGYAPVLRSGARPGDWIMVSGRLGGSIHGRQFSFTPRIELGVAIAERGIAHAMMDLSDGIASDLPRICKASAVGALIDESKIPVHDDVRLRYPKSSWIQHALCDGEDFELMFACDAKTGQRLLNGELGNYGDMYQIGEVTASQSIRLRAMDGSISELSHSGYLHSWG